MVTGNSDVLPTVIGVLYIFSLIYNTHTYVLSLVVIYKSTHHCTLNDVRILVVPNFRFIMLLIKIMYPNRQTIPPLMYSNA